MTIKKNGCVCGGDYHTTTEQCDNIECKSERKKPNYKKAYNILLEYWDSIADEEKEDLNKRLEEIGL